MRSNKTYEGLQRNVRGLKLPHIDVWENQYSDKKYVIKFDTSEFTCVCPKTGLPDFASIFVEYIPGKWCVELKSYKEYLMAYRTIGIFHEHVVNRILADLVKSTTPVWMRVRGVFNTRGGISTTVETEYDNRK